MKYQEIRDDKNQLTGILRTTDNATIPVNTNNRDYQEYTEWVSAGNIPDHDPSQSLSNLKLKALETIRQSAKHQIDIVGEWNLWRQRNAIAGVYGTIPGGTKPVLQHCVDYITSIIAQSNTYEDQVNIAVDRAGVDSVLSSITWDITGIYSYTEVKNGA